MDEVKTMRFSSRDRWRSWLSDHGSDAVEAWVVLYKKSASKRSMTYDEALDEAICFGWIDSRVRRVDDESYAVRFTPRKDGATWSKYNLARAHRLIAEGRMMRAGLKTLPPRFVAAFRVKARRPVVIDPRRRVIAYARKGARAG